jgi:hypothetical protein
LCRAIDDDPSISKINSSRRCVHKLERKNCNHSPTTPYQNYRLIIINSSFCTKKKIIII